jgi:hypothetical protein
MLRPYCHYESTAVPARKTAQSLTGLIQCDKAKSDAKQNGAEFLAAGG